LLKVMEYRLAGYNNNSTTCKKMYCYNELVNSNLLI